MESTSVFSSFLPLSRIPPRQSPPQNSRFRHIKRSSINHGIALSARRDSYRCNSSNNSNDFYGELLVDESMIVLRKRIHEMKMIERNYEPPEGWMEWEKQCYAGYDQFICKVVGLLQMQLMNTRPSLALGLLFLVTMSVPLSTVMVASQLMEAGGGFIDFWGSFWLIVNTSLHGM